MAEHDFDLPGTPGHGPRRRSIVLSGGLAAGMALLAAAPTPQQAWNVRLPTVPLNVGWLQPDDISPVAVFLASDAAAMVTGVKYEVTGGDSAKDV